MKFLASITTLIFSLLFAFVVMADNNTNLLIDFENENAQNVEAFSSIDAVQFSGAGLWQRIDLGDAGMFEHLHGAVIADTSYTNTTLSMQFVQAYNSVVFDFGFGQFQNTTSIDVKGYLNGRQVFAATFDSQRNRLGFYEGLALVDTRVDRITVEANDSRALLALDNIQARQEGLSVFEDANASFASLQSSQSSNDSRICNLLGNNSNFTIKAGGEHSTTIARLQAACTQ